MWLRKILSTSVLIVVISGCGSSDMPDPRVVPFDRLINNQEKYEGKTVKVEGYLERMYVIEGMPLVGYALYSDQSSMEAENSIGLVFRKGLDEHVLEIYVGSSILVSGFFVNRFHLPPALSDVEIISGAKRNGPRIEE